MQTAQTFVVRFVAAALFAFTVADADNAIAQSQQFGNVIFKIPPGWGISPHGNNLSLVFAPFWADDVSIVLVHGRPSDSAAAFRAEFDAAMAGLNAAAPVRIESLPGQAYSMLQAAIRFSGPDGKVWNAVAVAANP